MSPQPRQPQWDPAAEVIPRAEMGGRYLTCQNLATGTLSGAVGSDIQARYVIYAAWRQECSAESRASVEGRSFPVMEATTRVGNRLLAALPAADFDLLAPHLRKVSLERDAVLVRLGDRIEQIYFPLSGTIAFIMDMPNGQTVATAVIGNEGAVGILSALGPSRFPMTAVVRVAGTSLQISPRGFQAALSRSGAIRDAVQIYTKVLLTQFQHVAACNALHSVEARLARWLLHIHDRVDSEFLPLTQEALAELLGVRRTTVTHVVRKLRTSRAIRSNRRGLIEIDRPRLEAAACECYEVMRRRIDRIVSPEGMKSRIHVPPVHKIPRARDPLLAKVDEAQRDTRTHGATSPRPRGH
jgi:CRP-like cAMP-binding protein